MIVTELEYQANFDRINQFFPNLELLTRKDIMNYTGLSRNTIPVVFPYEGKYISKVNFARMVTDLGAEK